MTYYFILNLDKMVKLNNWKHSTVHDNPMPEGLLLQFHADTVELEIKRVIH